MNKENFKQGDLVYWIYTNGDKTLCSVLDVLDDDRLRVMWHKDGFVNLMPKSGFIKVEENDKI